ncbi:hypothetical protein HZS_6449 [Henneguya salminicola]|nr:hypothetical protein HZS_6449 [Henneguya salminicola]
MCFWNIIKKLELVTFNCMHTGDQNEHLFCFLRSEYASLIYKIPSKKSLNTKIRSISGSMEIYNIHSAVIKLQKSLKNGLGFLRRY